LTDGSQEKGKANAEKSPETQMRKKGGQQSDKKGNSKWIDGGGDCARTLTLVEGEGAGEGPQLEGTKWGQHGLSLRCE